MLLEEATVPLDECLFLGYYLTATLVVFFMVVTTDWIFNNGCEFFSSSLG